MLVRRMTCCVAEAKTKRSGRRDAWPLLSEESVLIGIELVGSRHGYSQGSERVQDADG